MSYDHVHPTPNKTVKPRKSQAFDAIPEDAQTQDELNRRLHKPGEPGYCASAKNGESGKSSTAIESDSQ